MNGLECLYGVKYSLQEHPALHKKEYFWRHRDTPDVRREGVVYLENNSAVDFFCLLSIWNQMGAGDYVYYPRELVY